MEKPLRQAIKPFLDDLRDRKITGRQVARELGVSETSLSKTLSKLGLKKIPVQNRAEQRQLRQAREAYRRMVATSMPVKDAAKAANCHPRTIKRLLEKLQCKTTA